MCMTGMRRTTGGCGRALTLNFGLRYEYFSPYVEKNNRLVNLDHNADFTQVAAVLPGCDGAVQRERFRGRW